MKEHLIERQLGRWYIVETGRRERPVYAWMRQILSAIWSPALDTGLTWRYDTNALLEFANKNQAFVVR